MRTGTEAVVAQNQFGSPPSRQPTSVPFVATRVRRMHSQTKILLRSAQSYGSALVHKGVRDMALEIALTDTYIVLQTRTKKGRNAVCSP